MTTTQDLDDIIYPVGMILTQIDDYNNILYTQNAMGYLNNVDKEFSGRFSLPEGRYILSIQYGSTGIVGVPEFLEVLNIEVFADSFDGLFSHISLGETLLPTETRRYVTFDVRNIAPYIIVVSQFLETTPPLVTPPETPPTTTPVQGTISVGSFWEGLVNGINGAATSINNSIFDRLDALVKAANGIVKFFENPLKPVIDSLAGLFTEAVKQSGEASVKVVTDATSHSPDWATDIRKMITSVLYGPLDDLAAEMTDTALSAVILSRSEAWDKLVSLGNKGRGVLKSAYTTGVIAEAASLGQLEGVEKYVSDVIIPFGLTHYVDILARIPLNAMLEVPATQYWNSIYLPNIPDAAELINMRVKEKLTEEKFNENLGYQGLSPYWAKKIWDAHFIAPQLGQLLTSWRRHHITTEELDKYQILVDLDPVYKGFWEDQRYIDPSITEARFMFETNAINPEGVKDIVLRNAYLPSDAQNLTDFIVRFQERLFRRRYLLTLASGYRQGVYNQTKLQEEVVKAGFTFATSEWIVRNADAQNEIVAAKKKPLKDVLLTLSIVQDAYINDDVDDAFLSAYFYSKGYDPFEIEIALKVYKRKKTAKKAGENGALNDTVGAVAPTVSLTVAADAYIHGDVTQTWFESYFASKNYTSDEIALYIAYYDRLKAKT